jgi:GNAT superfamily N-acetyltransferase
VIRAASGGDLAGILALYRHLNPDDPDPDAARAEAAWSAIVSAPMMTVFVAEADDRLVSSCTLVIVPNLTRAARPYGLVENVVTHAEYRNRGLARSVLKTALDAAWAAGCYKVMLATGSKNPETLRFYEQSGFERGGKTFFQARRA